MKRERERERITVGGGRSFVLSPVSHGVALAHIHSDTTTRHGTGGTGSRREGVWFERTLENVKVITPNEMKNNLTRERQQCSSTGWLRDKYM